MSAASRFLAIWLAALVALLASVAGLNYLVDPYDVRGAARIAGFNLYKPQAKNHSMLAKTYQVERARPATVILGTSRANLGVDSNSPAWPAEMQPVYNYGIPGYRVQTLFYTLQEAHASGRLREAVVILDFPGFLALDPAPDLDEDERRLLLLEDGKSNPYRSVQRMKDVFFALLTMGSTVDSVSTVLAQWQREKVLDLRTDGSTTDAEFYNAVKTDGLHTLFARWTHMEIPRAAGAANLLNGWRAPLPNLNVVAAMIDYAKIHRIGLTLILAPMHADALELYRAKGLWPRIEQLKGELAALVGQAGGSTIGLWDFVEYGPYTTERAPPPVDRTTMLHWFWEPVHFRKELGDIMLRRIFRGGSADFGMQLTPPIIDARNRQVRAQQRTYIEKSLGDGRPSASLYGKTGGQAQKHGPE